jgi:hypothetical protein
LSREKSESEPLGTTYSPVSQKPRLRSTCKDASAEAVIGKEYALLVQQAAALRRAVPLSARTSQEWCLAQGGVRRCRGCCRKGKSPKQDEYGNEDSTDQAALISLPKSRPCPGSLNSVPGCLNSVGDLRSGSTVVNPEAKHNVEAKHRAVPYL